MNSENMFSKPGMVLCISPDGLKTAISMISRRMKRNGIVFSYVKGIHSVCVDKDGVVTGEGFTGKNVNAGVWVAWENDPHIPIRLFSQGTTFFENHYQEHPLHKIWSSGKEETLYHPSKIAVKLTSGDVWNKVFAFLDIARDFSPYHLDGPTWSYKGSAYRNDNWFVNINTESNYETSLTMDNPLVGYSVMDIDSFVQFAMRKASMFIHRCHPDRADVFRKYYPEFKEELPTNIVNHDHDEYIQTAPGAHTATEGCGILRPFRKHGQIASASRLTENPAQARGVKTKLRFGSLQPHVLSS
jgi:hypothetical protein